MSSIKATTLRLTGMASGMDTESIVEDLMKASKLKIDKVSKQKTLLEWKQEYYKEITSKLNTFKSKYFGAASSETLMTGALSMLSATYSSPYVSIQTSKDTAQGSLYISDIQSLASGSRLEGTQAASANPAISVNTAELANLAGKSIAVSLDGITKNITFSNRTYATSQDVQTELTSQLTASFGAGRVNAALSGDAISLSSANSSLRISLTSDASANPTGILDFENYSSNRLDFSVSLSQAGLSRDIFASPTDNSLSFTINGKPFSFTGNSTMNDIMTAVNSSDAGVKLSYSSLTDTFSMASNTTGATSSISVQDNNGYLMDALLGGGKYTAGTDAVVRLSTTGSQNDADMITIQRSTNSFTVNGSTVSLLGKASGDTKEGITATFGHDTDAIVKQVKSFVDDYNSLLGSITGRLGEERDKDYEPLTDDEKKEMSDEEVKLWTEKAKSGILRNDIYLQNIASELRSSMYASVQGLNSSETLGVLGQIGITSGNYSDKGQLHLDEAKLREALSSDAENTIAMLTQKSSVSYSLYSTTEQQGKRFSESGVLWRIGDVLSKNLSTVGKKGALISLVGSPNGEYKGETEYGVRIANIQSRIERMNDKLVDEENRYWNQFTAMETAMSKLNSQSSWITSMLGQN